MKTIIDKQSGKVLYCVTEIDSLKENEIAVDELLNEDFVSAFYNFDTKEFYEGATDEQIAEYQNEILQQKKQIANELLKETDWYITRFAETGKEIPKDILELRQQIRDNA
jgi:hypothetical protein